MTPAGLSPCSVAVARSAPLREEGVQHFGPIVNIQPTPVYSTAQHPVAKTTYCSAPYSTPHLTHSPPESPNVSLYSHPKSPDSISVSPFVFPDSPHCSPDSHPKYPDSFNVPSKFPDSV